MREIVLLRLPAEPAAVAKAVQLVACGELSEAAAAAALRCERPTLSELSHAFESADGDEQATQCHPAVRACAATLANRGARHRPAQFSSAERTELAAVAAAVATGGSDWAQCEECELYPWDAAALGPLDPEAGLAHLP